MLVEMGQVVKLNRCLSVMGKVFGKGGMAFGKTFEFVEVTGLALMIFHRLHIERNPAMLRVAIKARGVAKIRTFGKEPVVRLGGRAPEIVTVETFP